MSFRVSCSILVLVVAAGCHSPGRLACQCSPTPNGEFSRAQRRDRAFLDRAWTKWADENLQNGDIVFGMGDARVAFGLFPFSKVFAGMADSRFSHTGLIAREQDNFYVYDMAPGGPRRMTFADYLIDDEISTLAIKRLKPEYQSSIPDAIAYCKRSYENNVIFDKEFQPNNNQLYCSEMTEAAFRRAGVRLSDAIKINQLPRYHEYPRSSWLVQQFSKISPDNEVFVPGNETIGIWSSPALELVYETPATHGPPPVESAGPALFSRGNRLEKPVKRRAVEQTAGGAGYRKR